MDITKREFLRRLGIGGAAMAGGAAFADKFVRTNAALPPGSCGDPDNVAFGRKIFPLEHTMADGPSCSLKDGKVFQPAREIPVFHTTDVVVVGGGPAGFAAAIAAARTGSKVALVERYGSLGGLFTNGMVLIMLCTSTREDGKFRLVTKGICEEFARRARALGSHVCTGPVPETRHWQPTVDPEGAKYLMDKMVAKEKVDMFFHCWGVDTIQDGGKVLGIIFESKQGRQAILAKQVVDCTGDADVLFQAGGDYRQITHGIGHVVRLANMDRITAKTPPKGKKGKWPTRSNEANKSAWWGNTDIGPKGNGLDVRDLTAAEIGFRRRWWEHVAEMRQEPGWEQVFIANTCSQIGPRATRLVDAECVVGRKTLRGGYRPDDSIGWFGDDGRHKAFPVPYRQLVPKKVDNLLCAGRCLGTGDTIDTFRLICPCFVTGQAAGTAAALAAQAGVAPRALPYSTLRRALEKGGAYIG
ncbi:MAG: FAD-dependent oxidoreductase [Kiritimatiellae bacterium]|nr:FAD-dependent oxidoreductase [Kiritimatiellia bacterium]